MTKRPPLPACEFATVDDAGAVTDAELHAEILNNPAAEAAAIRQTRDRLIAQGEDPALMRRLYPITDEEPPPDGSKP